METRSNFGSPKFGTTKIRNDNEDYYASINLPLTLSPPSARADTLEVTCDDFLNGTYCSLCDFQKTFSSSTSSFHSDSNRDGVISRPAVMVIAVRALPRS